MAIVRAIASGNWSNTAIWNTGALPTSADDVYSNTFTVTIDISPTVLTVNNTAATGVTAGGGFAVSATGLTLTANVQAASATCLTVSVGAGSTFNIVGNCSAGFSNTPPAVVFNSGGTLNVTGNCNGGSSTSNNGFGVSNTSSGTVNITGVCTGGTASNSHAVNNSSTGTVNITGTCTSGSVAGTNYAVNNSSTGTITITGAMQASGSVAVNSGNAGALVILSGPFFVSANGTHAVLCPNWKWANSNLASTYYQIRTANQSTIRPLYTADSVGGNPAVTNVRSGTVYGPASELTGTCAVPAAASVAFGVPVDNTTGTATLTAANVRAAVGLASANLDTQLSGITSGISALPSASAIASAVWAAATRTLTAAIDNSSTIAAAVWSYATGRTITGGTVDTLVNSPSVPSAASIASQVRTELTPELARVANCATTQEVDDIVEGALS